MKHILRKIYKRLIFILRKCRLYRLHMCLTHMNALYDGRRNIRGFLRACASELFGLGADLVIPRRECLVCSWKGYEFSPVYLGDNYRPATRCPRCMTYERHRLLKFYAGGRISPEARSLVVGPNKYFSQQLFKSGYLSLDINPDHEPDIVGDLENLTLPSEEFDYIVCFRVLEHVPNTRKALEGLLRVLKPCGSLFVSVPLYKGMSKTLSYLENRSTCERGPTWSYPDHCHDFALQDLEALMKEVGFNVSLIEANGADPTQVKYKMIPHNDEVGIRLGLEYTDIILKGDRVAAEV